MKIKHLGEDLYDYVTNRINDTKRHDLEKHIEICKYCQKEIGDLKQSLNLLDQIQPPPLSEEFKESVWERLRALPSPPKLTPKPLLFQRVKEWFQISPLRWGFEGVAVMVVLLLTFTIYKNFTTDQFYLENIPKELQIELSEIKNPIIIETANVESSFEGLKEVIRVHNGKFLQVIQVDKGMKITISLEKGKEALLFDNLIKIGKLWMKKEGYKDGQGNIVILLIKKR